MVLILKFLCSVTPSCQLMIPANVLIGRGSPLLMYLLSPAFWSSPNLNLDLMVFWTQYPGSRHGEISMLQHKHVPNRAISLGCTEKGSSFRCEQPHKLLLSHFKTHHGWDPHVIGRISFIRTLFDLLVF